MDENSPRAEATAITMNGVELILSWLLLLSLSEVLLFCLEDSGVRRLLRRAYSKVTEAGMSGCSSLVSSKNWRASSNVALAKFSLTSFNCSNFARASSPTSTSLTTELRAGTVVVVVVVAVSEADFCAWRKKKITGERELGSEVGYGVAF